VFPGFNLLPYAEQEDQDWGIVAMVLDRLFLWVFGICAFFGSLMILSDSPYIYEVAASSNFLSSSPMLS
jgi:hypothetical protein